MGAMLAPLLIVAPIPAFAQTVSFNVPEQPAITGIPEFARQARIQIVSPAGLQSLKTRAVKGRLSIDEGLQRLLRGTNLYVAARTGSVVSLAIRPRAAKPAPAPRPIRHPPPARQTPAPTPLPPPVEDDIVVTGTVAPQRKIDAGLAVTIASVDRIRELAPNNTADVLKLAPGIWAETTGGVTGANVFVRGFPTNGDAPFLTVQLDGAPIYPPTELSFSENTTLFRIDDMIDRVEIVRGGTNPIFANGQPGAVMNFIQRTGTPKLGGGLRLTGTDYGTRRVDGYVTGPIAPDTQFAIGGFYRVSDGLRSTQFPADRGGQITANVTRRFDDGIVTAYARYTRDQNAFYTGVPLLAEGDGRFAALPGFDPLRDTLIGRDTRRLSIEAGPGDYRATDLSDGRGIDMFLAGATLDWSPSDRVRITNRFNITTGSADTIGLFTGPVPVTLGQYISDTVGRANADPRIVAVAGLASSGQATITSSGAAIPADRYVLTAGLWSVKEKIAAITNELRISTRLGNSHRLTGGLYLSRYRSDDLRLLGNNLLLLAEPNAERIDLRLDNGVLASRDGFVSATTNQVVSSSSSTNAAFFLADEWSLSRRLTVDAGLRYERQWLRGQVRGVRLNADFDGNPLTLYDNNGALLLPSVTTITDNSARLSWSTALIYKVIPDQLTLHFRYNRGSNLPSFEKLRMGGPRAQSADLFEAGADYTEGPVRASVNTFINRFTGLQFSRLLEQPDGSVGTITLLGGARAMGVEVETDVTPSRRWKLEFRGTWEDGHYSGLGPNTGNRVVRQPNVQFAVTPVYSMTIGRADLKLRASYNYVGVRYSDVENLQRLPTYSTVDLGLHADLRNGLYADIVASNLFNALGLTEGNTRVLGDVLSSGPIIARPLFGRNVSLSLGYRF